jgi:hypothetical protein
MSTVKNGAIVALLSSTVFAITLEHQAKESI